MNALAMTTLRNGAEVPAPILRTVMLALERLMEADPISLYELVQIAKEPTHRMFGYSGPACAELALLEPAPGNGWEVRSYVRDVILSAVDGSGLDLSLRWPAEVTP